jgi:hypothetical protein
MKDTYCLYERTGRENCTKLWEMGDIDCTPESVRP